MDIEQAFLSKVIESRNFRNIIDNRVTGDFFADLENRRLYDKIKAHWEDYGEVPTRAVALDKFGFFEEPPADDIRVLVAQLLNQRRYTKAAEILQDAAIEAADDPEAALKRVHTRSLDVLEMYSDASQDFNLLTNTSEMLERYARFKANKYAAMVFPWETLNKATLGIHPGNLIFIYGRPKTLKSWLLQCIANYLLVHKKKRIIYATQEMTPVEVQMRAVALYNGFDYGRFRAGRLTSREEMDFRDNLEPWGEQGLFQAVQLRGQGEDAATELEAKVAEYRADVAFIDGVYLAAGKWEQIVSLTRGLQKMAKRTLVPVLGTIQENRQGQTAYSDSFLQDCDMLLRTERDKEMERNNELLLTVPAMREARVGGFKVNALPAYNFQEKYNEDDLAEEGDFRL